MFKKAIYTILTLILVTFSTSVYAKTITVEKGDTLSKIAQQENVSLSKILENNDIKDPNLIYPGQQFKIPTKEKQSLLGAKSKSVNLDKPFPEDSYDTFISSPVNAGDSKIFVNTLPAVDNSVYTIFESDGRTVSEKIHCTGVTTTPSNALTGCARDISAVPNSDGTIDEISQSNGNSHSKNARIAITNNINFTGKGLSMLFGNQTSSLKKTDQQYLYIGDGTTSSDQGITINNDRSNEPFIRYDEGNQQFVFSDDGINSQTFGSSSPLSASSTGGIGIDNSKIYAKLDSSGGLAFDGNGKIKVDAGQNSGIGTGPSGIYVETYDDFDWQGEHTFNGAPITSTPTNSSAIIKSSSTGKIDSGWIKTSFRRYSEFGNKSDGSVTIDSGSFSSGPISNNSLQRDAHFDKLTLDGGNLETNGFKLYADTIEAKNGEKIFWNGNSGGDASTNNVGSGGAALSGKSVPGTLPGGKGAESENGGDPDRAGGGDPQSDALGVNNSVAGGDGGDGTGFPANNAGVNSGDTTQANAGLPKDVYHANSLMKPGSGAFLNNHASASGGGGGGEGDTGAGGNGGGSGTPGGVVAVYAKKIIGNPVFQAKGGAGGSGGDAAESTAGDGGGGGGGNGGIVVLVYVKKGPNVTSDVTGGSGGSPGNNGQGGQTGGNGKLGKVYEIQLSG